MLGFWLTAGGMTLAALAFVLARLVFPRRLSPHVEPREANLAALRASRAELEHDRALGLLPEGQAEAALEEITRRAAEELDEAPAAVATRPAWAAAAVAAIAIPVAAYAAYAAFGSPDAIGSTKAFAMLEGDLRRERLPALREQLARHISDHPGDGRAWALLARVELALDRPAQSQAAFERAVADRKVARDPGIWCDYADATGLVQGGRLEGKPAQFIARALELDAAHPQALEMAGSLAIERGDYAGATRQWRLLLDRLAADDPRRVELARAISRVERLAGPGMT